MAELVGHPADALARSERHRGPCVARAVELERPNTQLLGTSPDAIPVHLLTVEAFSLFKDHVREGGAIAVHVSNRNVELDRLVARLGREFGYHALRVRNEDIEQVESQAATWMLLSPDPERLRRLRDNGTRYRESLQLPPGAIRFQTLGRGVIDRAPLWTDDYSDLFGALVLNTRGDAR